VGHNGYYPEKNNIPYGIVQNNKNNKQISVITGGDNGVQKLAVFRRPLSSPATIARYHRPLSSPTIIIAHYHRPLPSPTTIAHYHRPLSSPATIARYHQPPPLPSQCPIPAFL
jgi:hypothetical protein